MFKSFIGYLFKEIVELVDSEALSSQRAQHLIYPLFIFYVSGFATIFVVHLLTSVGGVSYLGHEK